MGFLSEWQWGSQGSSQIATGSQASSRIEAWSCGFLPSCKSITKLPLKLRWELAFFLELQQMSQSSHMF